MLIAFECILDLGKAILHWRKAHNGVFNNKQRVDTAILNNFRPMALRMTLRRRAILLPKKILACPNQEKVSEGSNLYTKTVNLKNGKR